jgi:GAF domain-containing protein
MITPMTQTPNLNIFQLEVLPENPTTDCQRQTADTVLASSVPAGNCTSDRCLDQAKLECLTKELKEITTLYNIGVTIGSSLNLGEVIWTLYKESGRLLDTANFAIGLYDHSTDTLDFALLFEQGRRLKARPVKLNETAGLLKRVLAEKTPLLLNDPPSMSLAHPGEPVARLRGSARSWLGAPIRNPAWPDEAAQGVIVVWSDRPGAFDEHEVWLLSAIAPQAAIAIHNAHLYEAVLAERDRAAFPPVA